MNDVKHAYKRLHKLQIESDMISIPDLRDTTQTILI